MTEIISEGRVTESKHTHTHKNYFNFLFVKFFNILYIPENPAANSKSVCLQRDTHSWLITTEAGLR